MSVMTIGNSEQQHHWIQNLTLVGTAIMRYMTLDKAFKRIILTISQYRIGAMVSTMLIVKINLGHM